MQRSTIRFGVVFVFFTNQWTTRIASGSIR
jgi:hypothetical protein